MKFNLETNGQTFTVTTRTDKKATSNYDTEPCIRQKTKIVVHLVMQKNYSKNEGRGCSQKMYSNVLTN